MKKPSFSVDPVDNGQRVVGYLTSALRAGVWSLDKYVNEIATEFWESYGLTPGITVSMEAPMEEQRYPYLHVMYKNNKFEPLSLKEDSWTKGAYLHSYRFEGEYLVNIYATTILERETIADALIGAMGIDMRFKQAFLSNPFINVHPNLKNLQTPMANESWGTPWALDVQTCFRQLNFPVRGEFFYLYKEEPIYLTKVQINGIEEIIGDETIAEPFE